MTASRQSASSHASANTCTDVSVDVLILGGGIAGLWALARFLQAGYKTVLLESDALGAGQTRFAQGIIHGGTKYALTGKLTASSEAVADMPARWRACYAGQGELDLSAAELLSESHYLWSTGSLTSRISGFFASKVMRSRSSVIDKNDQDEALPSLFRHKDFHGQFYQLDEPVFNTLSVVKALAAPRQSNILSINADSLEVAQANQGLSVQSQQGDRYRFHAAKTIFLAGQGNEHLLSVFGYERPKMQRRPLRMVVIRGNLHDRIYAHCLGASVNPRITITSHYDASGEIVWYMGGQLAEDGVELDNAQLLKLARQELTELIPWLDLSPLQWGIVDIDRAEIRQSGVKRPDSFSIDESNEVITAWPTKMALSPGLADALLAIVERQNIPRSDDMTLPEWSESAYAVFPWDENTVWEKGQ